MKKLFNIVLISFICLYASFSYSEIKPNSQVESNEKEEKTSTDDFIKKLEEKSLEKAKKNIQGIQSGIAENTNNKDNLIIPELLKVKNIEESITNEINIKREEIKTFIYSVATALENNEDVLVSVDEYGISVEKILEAKNKNNVTARSIKMAFDILSKINNEIINMAKEEADPKKKRDLALQEAALVYEMADLTIEIVNDAVLEGSPILKKYKLDEESKINKDIKELNDSLSQLEKQHDNSEIKKSFYENMSSSYKNQVGVNISLLDKWKEIGVIFNKQDQQLERIKKDVESIKHIRKNALYQINILKRAKIAKAVHSTVGPINDLIDISKELKLIELDSSYFSDICVTGDC